MLGICVLAQDASRTDADRKLYRVEFATLAEYVREIAARDFDGQKLFAGGAVPTNGGDQTTVAVNLSAPVYQQALSSTVDTVENATRAFELVRAAKVQLTVDRADIGSRLAGIVASNKPDEYPDYY